MSSPNSEAADVMRAVDSLGTGRSRFERENETRKFQTVDEGSVITSPRTDKCSVMPSVHERASVQ
jgi:hypothetical protein